MSRFAIPEALPNGFTLQPLIDHGAHVDLIATLAAAVLAATLALVPRRFVSILPAVLAALFVWISVDSSREIVERDHEVQASSTGPNRRWIDRHADGPVSYLFIGDTNWPAVWQNVFWNRRIERVYDLAAVTVPGGMPQTRVDPSPDGRFPGVTTPYLVSLYPVAFVGKPVATVNGGLVLWRLEPPARISVWTQRVAGHVRVLAYGCRGGSLRLALHGPPPGDVELRRNDAPYARVRLDAAGRWSGTIPALPPRPNGTCTFDVISAPAVIAPTVEFRR
jgi:hypothetical protein